MRVLITGSAGFLGYHLVRKFLDSGHRVIGVDDLSGGNNGVSSGNGDDYEFYLADCTNVRLMDAIFELTKPDVVYHAACFPHEGLSVVSPFLITHSVTGGTNAVLSASAKHKVKKFIFCSSMSRYGNGLTKENLLGHERVFHEIDIPLPVDPYGWAKYAAEGQVRAVCEAYGIEFTIIVPHNIYGPYQKFDDPFRNVAAIMVNRALRGKQPLIYGDGRQTRCFSHVKDLVTPFYNLIHEPRSHGEVINFGPDQGPISINELARIVCEHTKIPFDPIYMPDRPREVKHANCSAHKARYLLGVDFKTSIYDGIGDLVEYVKKVGPKEFVYHLPIEINSPLTPRTWTERLI